MKTTIIPHTRPGLWPDAAADRFARTIKTISPNGCAVALLGLPDDTGVHLNHGRPGAAKGPGALRAALAKYGTAYDAVLHGPIEVGVYDAGDVMPAEGDTPGALEETHGSVTEAVGTVHKLGMIPVCVGGGHDLTFPAVRALSRHVGRPVGGVNFDSHLDVRSTLGSGMPFRALIDGNYLDAGRYAVVGAGRFTNSGEHVEWMTSRGGVILTVEELLAGADIDYEAVLDFIAGVEREEDGNGGSRARADVDRSAPERASFVSIDLDALDASVAPGVSAPNPMGLPVADAVDLAHLAGEDPAVRHFDLMEMCPMHDIDSRTSRVAAMLLRTIVAGVQERGA